MHFDHMKTCSPLWRTINLERQLEDTVQLSLLVFRIKDQRQTHGVNARLRCSVKPPWDTRVQGEKWRGWFSSSETTFHPPHKVHIYLEYHSVCPLVGIGTPTPSPASECASPRNQRGVGVHTSLRVRGWGSPNRTKERKLTRGVPKVYLRFPMMSCFPMTVFC